MTYFVTMPNGKKFPLTGDLRRVEVSDLVVPVIGTHEIDQRAIVTDENGKEVYNPRANMDGLAPELLQWMMENDTWGR